MSNITANSKAAANAAGVKNVVFKPSASVVPRKILIIGTGDPSTEAANPTDTPVLVTSPEDVGSKTGFGYMLHRLAVQSDLGANGIETWIIQQPEGVATQAAGELDFTGSTGIVAGTLHLYISGIYVPVTVTAAMTVEQLADAVVAAITANDNLPVSAVKVAVTFEVTITAKSGGLDWGDKISLAFNIKDGDVFPTGVTAAITTMTGGAGAPDIQNALDSLGTGDGANENFFTDVVHGYGPVAGTLDKISGYVGEGNGFTGLYDKVVHKPFRALTGDVVAQSAGLTAILAIANGRKEDRGNGVISVPGSKSHPSEIAAQTIGHLARINNNRAEQNYLDIVLIGIDPGVKSDRWTSEYTNRDTAVKAGVSATKIKSGAVVLQNVQTFYHPDSVPASSNGYASMRNISILQNILFNVALNFENEKWDGISIVADVTRVGNFESRKKARDTNSVRDDLVALARSFESNAWIFDSSFTIDSLRETGAIAIRAGGDGFDSTLKIVLSGEGNILNNTTEFDTSIAVFL
jgi:phage tail sheath gpL-like